MDMSKKSLAVKLSKLKRFESADIQSEQYSTDGEIAATLLWECHIADYINGKVVSDLGAGTGILGIGALLLGAKKIIFVEKDDNAIEILKDNLSKFTFKNYEIVKFEINDDSVDKLIEKIGKSDFVIQNPPFGTKIKHADRTFLKAAFSLADTVCSMHKSNTAGFLEAFSKDNGFKILRKIEFSFPIKKTMKIHKKPKKDICVAGVVFKRI